MKTKETAQTALNERWERIAKAESIDEMNSIILQTSSDGSIYALKEFQDWFDAWNESDFPAALTAAEAVCERLRGMTR